MAFQKGQSGNPGGRPKAVKAVIDAAREHTEAAMLTLAEIAGNGDAPAAARVTAAVALLDRGWGKPTQPTEISGPGGGALVIERRIVDPGAPTHPSAQPTTSED